MKDSLICRFFIKTTWILIVVSPLVLAARSALAQQSQNPNAGSNKEVPLNELLRLPGKLLAEGISRTPGNPNVAGYRVEELQLPRSIDVEVKGQQVSVDRAWRITLNGGPFPVRALPAVIWIDDEIVGYGIENAALSQVSAITFDSSLIREGGLISLSYGEDKDVRLQLSQRLHLKREGEKQ
jgi:hypothetical protein